MGNAIKSSLRGAALKSNKEGTRSIQVEITPTSSRISRNAVTSLSIRGHRWKRHGEAQEPSTSTPSCQSTTCRALLTLFTHAGGTVCLLSSSLKISAVIRQSVPFHNVCLHQISRISLTLPFLIFFSLHHYLRPWRFSEASWL